MEIQGVRLKSLDIEGFRGVNRRIHLEFGPRATIVSASNGRGKSTLLGAVEWALFGELKFQPSENRTHDEIVSLFHPGNRASVQLTLTDKGKELRIKRTRTIGKMASDVEVTDGTGRELNDRDVTETIFRLTGLSFDDFYRAAYLHQDSIRGLLTEDQKDRDEALDRLLGVEKIRNILTSIPLKPVTAALDEIETQEGRIMEHLAGAGGMAETARDRAVTEAREAGFAEEDLTLEKGQSESSTLVASMNRACKKYDGEAPGELAVETAEDLERVARKIKATTHDIRLSVGKATPLDAAVGRIGEIKALKSAIESARAEVKAALDETKAHLDSHGFAAEWAAEKGRLEASIALDEASLHVLDVHGRVIADTIAFLEAAPETTHCPVCGDPKDARELSKRLTSLLKKDQAAEVRRLNKAVESAGNRLAELADLEKHLGKLVSEEHRVADELQRIEVETWKSLGNKGRTGDVLGELTAEEARLTEQLAGLRNLNVEREGDLQSLDDGADRLRILQRFLKAEADARRVREKAAAGEGGGAKALEEDKARLMTLRSELDAIIVALSGLASGRAEDALARCGPDISRVYGQLCNHPYFDGLKIEVSQKTVSGVQRNTYRIVAYSTKDGQRTSASSRLSTAQMNCVALSAYLSLAKVLSHNLGFIMLDDPSQNLDSEHKQALAAVLGELLPSRQIVVGTHDSEFDKFLKSALGRDGIAWYDLAWAPREGTSLKLDVPKNG